MRVYIAGPMRGYPEWNFPLFDQAKQIWQDRGWTVVNPADLDRALGYKPNTDPCTRETLNNVILTDVVSILHCDAIALLPNWEYSKGVAVELALAQFLGITIYDAITLKEISPDETPWKYC